MSISPLSRSINAFVLSDRSYGFLHTRRYCRPNFLSQRIHCAKNRLYATAGEYSLDLRIPTAEDMEDVAGLLSVDSRRGDVILLSGDLGVGKTCFSRGFIRARTGSDNERVTSPTYLLSNAYSVDRGEAKIHHIDLYRLSGSEDDLAPLDLENVFADEISLVEWPSRLNEMPSARLDITLTIDNTIQGGDGKGTNAKGRFMKLVPHGDRWIERLKFLESEGYFEDLVLNYPIALSDSKQL